MKTRKRGELMDEQNPEIQEDLGMGGKFKNWMQDNIRIIISVLIVVAIAGGIYSYSKRGEDVTTQEDIAIEEIEGDTESESAVAVVGGDEQEMDQEDAAELDNTDEDIVIEEEAVKENVIEEEQVETEEVETTQETASNQEEQVQKEDVKVDTGITENSSEETADAFVEKASSGDSVTTLARKALKDYLEKNQDSSLTPEQKIYIEDYLRKAVNHQGGVQVGTSISFSKNLIRDGIEKAKTLNEAQLNNLKKYSARVSNL